MLYSAMSKVCSDIHISIKIQSAGCRIFNPNLKVHKFTTGLERVKSECEKYVNKLKIKYYI
jgi:hypothetical protein